MEEDEIHEMDSDKTGIERELSEYARDTLKRLLSDIKESEGLAVEHTLNGEELVYVKDVVKLIKRYILEA